MLGISRNTVKKYCEGSQVPWERQGISGRQRYVITDEVLEFIKSCLAGDEAENIKKQKHTAKRIYDRLIEELDFTGGETTIREIVAEPKSGYKLDVTLYECESCEGCSIKKQCTKAAGNKTLSTSKLFLEKRTESLHNITTAEEILLRMNRSIQVEGTFGVLKEDHGFRRFLTREKKNVENLILAAQFWL